MMCCNECPFNPITGSAAEKCQRPLCSHADHRCKTGYCASNLGNRCFLDIYVINRLSKGDQLAEKLVFTSLKSALRGRDRALILSIFHAAAESLRLKLWRWLEVYEPRSLWLLNPIFAASGLAPLDSFVGADKHREKYLDAIVTGPCSGALNQQNNYY